MLGWASNSKVILERLPNPVPVDAQTIATKKSALHCGLKEKVMILIVTIDDDLHGLAVQSALRSRNVDCHIFATDVMVGRETMSNRIGAPDACSVVTTEGIRINPASASVIWLRRPKALQREDLLAAFDFPQRSLINNDSNGALNGLLQSTFGGTWISDPRSTERASNKILQLDAARKVGLKIPTTLISQVPEDVRAFYAEQEGRIIVKPVVGTPGPLLFTKRVMPEHLEREASICACPAIYQSFVDGSRHIRLNYFGEQSYGFSIDSSDVDWRPDLNVPIAKWNVPQALHNMLGSLLADLGLRMGIFDFKESAAGELHFLEVNPQGQFLFLEGITGEPLTERFADFLAEQAERSGPRCFSKLCHESR